MPNPITTARASDMPYNAMARPFRSGVEVSAIRAIELGPASPLPMPWLTRTSARRSGVVASEYRNNDVASQRRPTCSGSFGPWRSAIRPKKRFAGAWTAENNPTMIPIVTRSAPTCCAYSAMTGTNAFESMVPSIVAASRLSVRRRAIVGGTRATFKRISRHDSPNAADLWPSPERLRRRGDSMRRAHSTRRRFERARGHSRAPPGARRRDRDPQDRSRRLRPGTRWDRAKDPLRFLQLDGPQASLRTGPASPRRVPATARDPRRGPRGNLDVPKPAGDLGGAPCPRDDRAGSRPDDRGQGPDGAAAEHPLEASGQGGRGVRPAAQAEGDVARTAAAVRRRRTSEHRRDARPQPPRAVRIRPRRVLSNRRGPEEGAEDRGHQGRRDCAPIELALRRRSETLR